MILKKNSEAVCAVVVTYNRKNLLLECLEGLLKQTYPIDAIYLIDNASIDGTQELLFEKGYIKELSPEGINQPWEKTFYIHSTSNNLFAHIPIHYVRMHENTGGSGGFYEGCKRGYERGYNWLWLMDDDVEPLPDGLKNLFFYSNLSKCIHPSRCLPDGKRFQWGDIITKDGKSIPIDNNRFLEDKGKTYMEINTGCFEGMLIHKDVIAKIGFPMKDLFMVGDDTLYGWLASRHTKVIYIKDYCLKKKILPKKTKNTLTEYLLFRNRYYLLKIITGNSNLLKLKYFFHVINKILSRIFKYKSGKLAFAILKGYIDAVKNDFSNNYVKKLLSIKK